MSGFQGIPGFIDGTVTVVTLAETTPGAPAPTNIIARADTWRISVTLNLSGIGVQLLGNNVWHVKAFMESVGPGFEGQIGPEVTFTMPSPAIPLPFAHTFDINVPAATTVPNLIEGVYMLTVLLTLLSPAPANTPLPISAFSDAGTVSLYNA